VLITLIVVCGLSPKALIDKRSNNGGGVSSQEMVWRLFVALRVAAVKREGMKYNEVQ
jgi:hypothetical protein